MAKYQHIRDLREDADLSQEEMAKRLDLYKTTDARYETGRCEIPFSVAIRIAKYHKVTLDYLTAIVM